MFEVNAVRSLATVSGSPAVTTLPRRYGDNSTVIPLLKPSETHSGAASMRHHLFNQRVTRFRAILPADRTTLKGTPVNQNRIHLVAAIPRYPPGPAQRRTGSVPERP